MKPIYRWKLTREIKAIRKRLSVLNTQASMREDTRQWVGPISYLELCAGSLIDNIKSKIKVDRRRIGRSKQHVEKLPEVCDEQRDEQRDENVPEST